MLLLAIETSCDDTSTALFEDGKLLGQLTATQLDHAAWGGVVPELASRAHQQALAPLVKQLLCSHGKTERALTGIAYTHGPGLLGSLLVGRSFAQGLGIALGIPLYPIDHMQAHVLALYIEHSPPMPFLCLTVSGGHTQLVLVESATQHTILGRTRDDAAGEAFDKVAKMLGLPYPGGPLVDKLAQTGNPTAFPFPSANMEGLDYSFSGLKTAVLYFIRDNGEAFVQANLADVCASIQHTIIKTLMHKLVQAAVETGITHIGLAGGVSANSGLRKSLQAKAEQMGWDTYIPSLAYCTDNAAMIGQAAIMQFPLLQISRQPLS